MPAQTAVTICSVDSTLQNSYDCIKIKCSVLDRLFHFWKQNCWDCQEQSLKLPFDRKSAAIPAHWHLQEKIEKIKQRNHRHFAPSLFVPISLFPKVYFPNVDFFNVFISVVYFLKINFCEVYLTCASTQLSKYSEYMCRRQQLQTLQDHRRWRYHRKLLDYQSPYFQLKYPLDHQTWASSNSIGSLKSILSF